MIIVWKMEMSLEKSKMMLEVAAATARQGGGP